MGCLSFSPLDRIAQLWPEHLVCILSPKTIAVVTFVWIKLSMHLFDLEEVSYLEVAKATCKGQ